MIHELKILPDFFKAVKKGKKTFEIRTKDRPFKVNDHIVLKEWTGNDYTGEQVKVRIKYILDDENYLLKNTVAMSIEILDENIYPSATTEINIDYYEELKAKVDKWDEKETPYKPTGVEPFGLTKMGSCKCKQAVIENENYCVNCGQKLDWEREGE